MAFDFKLPDIGEGVVEGEIVRWLVKEGDSIAMDQPMVEVMTDKATVEIPSPAAGKVLTCHFSEGQICPVGKVLVSIETDGGVTTASDAQSGRGASERARSGAVSAPPPAGGESPMAAAGGSTAGVLATPATRKLARTLEVALSQVRGSGPAGRITSEDVRRYASNGASHGHAVARLPAHQPGSAAPPVPAQRRRQSEGFEPDVRVPFRGLRRRIAERLLESTQNTALYTYVEEVDATQLVALRDKANVRLAQGAAQKLSFLPFIIRATVEGLRAFPQMNAYLDVAASEIVLSKRYHIGLATATPDGLLVPVIRDADRKSILELGREIDRLAAATKAGKATREDLTGSTFTITSLGALGGLHATPILNQPEVGILGVHKIAKRPAVEGDKIVVRDLMNLSLSVDHRLVDGYDAARFVGHIKQSLEAPGLLFLDSI